MRREMTNRIRFVLEDIVPPVLRDSGLFKAAASIAWGVLGTTQHGRPATAAAVDSPTASEESP